MNESLGADGQPRLRRGSVRGPFSDLVVIEIGQFVVGPFCGQFLADGGARVIKVESLSGDPYRQQDALAPMESRQFTLKNRGKESLPLKLGHPDATAVLNRLFDAADVVIVNTRMETLRRHGISYAEVSHRNPRIVYALASGFGTVGPDAKYGGMDVVAQARSGLMLALGAEREELPYHSEVQAADYASALLLLAGIGAALHRRNTTGVGQEVSVSLLGGALTLQNNVFGHFYDHDPWRAEFIGRVLPEARVAGWSPTRLARERRALRPDPRDTTYYRVFRTSDGVIAVGAGSPAARRKFLALLGLSELDSQIEDDDATAAQRRRAVEERLRERPTETWLHLLRSEAVPVSEVNHVDEALFDEHFRAEGLVQEFDHPALGKYLALGAPIKLSESPFEPNRTSPAFGEHALCILQELGFTVTQINAMAADGAIALDPSRQASAGDDSYATVDYDQCERRQ